MAMSLDMGCHWLILLLFQRTVPRLDRAIEQQKATLSESLGTKENNWQERISELPIDWQQLRETLPKLNFHQRRL